MVPPSGHSRPALASVVEGKKDMQRQQHALSATCAVSRVLSDAVALERLELKVPIISV